MDLEDARDNLGDSEGLLNNWEERFGDMQQAFEELSTTDFEEFLSENEDAPMKTDEEMASGEEIPFAERYGEWLEEVFQALQDKWTEACEAM